MALKFSYKPEVPLDAEPTFDPNLGFPKGRKPRVMIATQEEMEAAKVPLEDRHYCAHTIINYRACISKNYPFASMCKHEMHDYHQCMENDTILRMKEYERESRLKERAKRIEKKQAKEQS